MQFRFFHKMLFALYIICGRSTMHDRLVAVARSLADGGTDDDDACYRINE
jgi:hypothetical protein